MCSEYGSLLSLDVQLRGLLQLPLFCIVSSLYVPWCLLCGMFYYVRCSPHDTRRKVRYKISMYILLYYLSYFYFVRTIGVIYLSRRCWTPTSYLIWTQPPCRLRPLPSVWLCLRCCPLVGCCWDTPILSLLTRLVRNSILSTVFLLMLYCSRV